MFIQYLQNDPRFFMAVVITVVVSICVHELAHGVVAVYFGDRTPIETGHMTVNPAVHLGMLSVITLMLAGIAWGSMPVDGTRLRGKYADALVSLAGPMSNVLLAVLALVSLGLWQRFDQSGVLSTEAKNIRFLLWVFGATNFNLALFNLIPFPPLDGSRIMGSLTPGYAETFRTISTMAPGAYISFIVVAFSAAGALTNPAAVAMSRVVLTHVRGY